TSVMNVSPSGRIARAVSGATIPSTIPSTMATRTRNVRFLSSRTAMNLHRQPVVDLDGEEVRHLVPLPTAGILPLPYVGPGGAIERFLASLCLSDRAFATVTSPAVAVEAQRYVNREPELIARVVAGDRLAARELYDAHVERVFRLAFRFTGDSELAREFTQETCIRAFAQLSRFRGDAALSTWL